MVSNSLFACSRIFLNRSLPRRKAFASFMWVQIRGHNANFLIYVPKTLDCSSSSNPELGERAVPWGTSPISVTTSANTGRP
jgi:hypothetical protein